MSSKNKACESFMYDSPDEDMWESSSSESDEDEGCFSSKSSAANVNSGRGGLSYDDKDPGPPTPAYKFKPVREPGIHVSEDKHLKNSVRKCHRPADFFKLFFTVELVSQLVMFTNEYAAAMRDTQPAVFDGWFDMTVTEFYRFIGLLMYMAMVQAPSVGKYWSTESLYQGLWAPDFMTEQRFAQIMSFLQVSNPSMERLGDELWRVRFLIEYIRQRCMKLFQPHQNLLIDERRVKNCDVSFSEQSTGGKQSKWKLKLWVLVEAATGYIYNFHVCLGNQGKDGMSVHGMTYDAVVYLVSSCVGQGYKVFLHCFRASVQLLRDLLRFGVLAYGAATKNRKLFQTREFFHNDQKNVTVNEIYPADNMRWSRDKEIVKIQWRGRKTAAIMSNCHSATDYHWECKRYAYGESRVCMVRQPDVIREYFTTVAELDKNDHLMDKFNVLRKTNKFWKGLFFQIIDIARMNSFVLLQEFRKKYPGVKELQRPLQYKQLDFMAELIRDLAGLHTHQDAKMAERAPHPLIPEFTSQRRNCKLCWSKRHIQQQVNTKCGACDTFLCFHAWRNCLLEYHQF